MYRRGHRKKGTMNEDLKKVFEIANYMTTLNLQKRELYEEFEQSCYYHKDGHTFKASEQMITFLTSLLNRNLESFLILDSNNEPYNIENIDEFLKDIIAVHTEAMNAYYYSYKKLVQQRSVESIITK
jgi:hypothetical protein